jgi:uncharacterized protein YeaO (DUF488 family)
MKVPGTNEAKGARHRKRRKDMYSIKIKRVYQDSSEDDGYRILVDRLWPRGISKEKINIHKWAKEITPSTELRKTFKHDPDTMDEFRARYNFELDNNEHALDFINLLKDKLKEGNVTLLYAAKNEKFNHAIVLKEWIERMISN